MCVEVSLHGCGCGGSGVRGALCTVLVTTARHRPRLLLNTHVARPGACPRQHSLSEHSHFPRNGSPKVLTHPRWVTGFCAGLLPTLSPRVAAVRCCSVANIGVCRAGCLFGFALQRKITIIVWSGRRRATHLRPSRLRRETFSQRNGVRYASPRRGSDGLA